jgi:mannosylglucosylglycerate synthase
MNHRILLVHFTPPGVVGGVEHIMDHHIRLLESRGFQVQVVAGRDEGSTVPVTVIPEIDVARPHSVALESQLASGVVGPDFWAARQRILDRLGPLVDASDTVIVHNAMTLHFCLPLTTALWALVSRRPAARMIAWCHDLSWSNPLYQPFMFDAYPWNLLRLAAPGVTYVAVSEERRQELATLWESGSSDLSVIPNGIDAAEFFRLSARGREIAEMCRVFDRDVVLLLPVRITRRKNLELAIGAVATLVERGVDALFLISGPVAPHHPSRSIAYLDELKALCSELGVSDRVIFLADALGANLDREHVSELFAMADVLVFPSAQEGFGIPVLEAALARLPLVLSDIPIFREVGGVDARYIPLTSTPDKIATAITASLDTPQSRQYRRVLKTYSWDRIIDDRLAPLLTDGRTSRVESTV